jgi:signal transduction histidine kinase
MRTRPSFRHPWLFMAAACLVPAALDVGQTVVQGTLGSGEGADWRLLAWQGGEWLILGALLPLTWYLGRRFPLRHPHVARHVGVHVLGALLLCIGWAGVGVALRLALWGDQRSLVEHVASWMLTSLPWSVFMYFTALGCVHAVTWFTEVREREAQASRLAAQVAEARLAALRLQFNPHFLFNSLNALLVLVRDHDARGAERMLERLSDVLRQVLRADQRHEVRLEEELRFLDDYLAVEQVRFSDRLQVVRTVDPALTEVLVPPFILQPLVENALRHGIGRSLEGGTIEIGARRDGNVVVLWVSDDGPGASPVPDEGGVGLRNIRERIGTLYGPGATLTLAGREEGGTRAEVRLPFRVEPQAVAAVNPGALPA